MEKFIPFIGLKYQNNARSDDVMDCWGLVVHLYSSLYNILLPSYSECSVGTYGLNKTANFILGTDLYKKCQKVDINCVKEGDLILINNLGKPTHIGMAVDNTHMIHCFDRAGSVIESFRSYKWKTRIVTICRHPLLL